MDKFGVPIENIDIPNDLPSASPLENEKFVNVISTSKIGVDNFYAKHFIKGAVNKCYLRKSVYDRLCQASKLLPFGYKFLIYDAWRPFDLQKSLYQYYYDILNERYQHIQMPEREHIITSFVAKPCTDRSKAPVHTTGGAIDLTILDKQGNPLNMGTEFDDFTDAAHTNYFENSENYIIRNNRRLLYNIMKECGFINLPSEWWHYEYGTRFWSHITGNQVKYDGIFKEIEIATMI